ncbi:hypothetical protein [Pseudoalteromonas maricaloris]|uniref:Uncharacterized protein n=1 Tax=Pseudoalteromonas maricaloris TaxID=184924 RepID=A0A8I2KNF9_9GAMM|nr:hypothetical protein [Pseudoalteromonas maricaloris]NLR24380.1 hypothetical protein [Pseudoalteromonas maricaloris]WOX26910.1 hypothetical protein R5H13_09525 [Pseudoalteromonas maricaloris]WOX31388.1 hypothetical protein R5H13_20835 [Pseudoalteromonas maricaloris]
MSSKSSSDARQTTNNTSTTFGIDGDNNGYITNGDGNTYHITQTDHGLVDALSAFGSDISGAAIAGFDAASNMTTDGFNFASDVTRNGFNYASDVNRDSLDFAGDALNQVGDTADTAITANSNLARDMVEYSAGLNSDVLDFAGDTLDTTVNALSDANGRIGDIASDAMSNSAQLAGMSIDAADNANARMSDLAYVSIDKGNNLARDLTESMLSATQDAYKTASDQSILANKQAFQFADNASRSDDQQLAVSTNKTMMVVISVVGGVAALGVVAYMLKE